MCAMYEKNIGKVGKSLMSCHKIITDACKIEVDSTTISRCCINKFKRLAEARKEIVGLPALAA